MEMYSIEKSKVNELLTWLQEQPFKFSNPVVGFLQQHLKTIENTTHVCAEAAEILEVPEVLE